MKRVFFGAIVALTLVACGGEEAVEEISEEAKQEVIEMETVTEEVSEGAAQLEEEVESLGDDVDELLNEI